MDPVLAWGVNTILWLQGFHPWLDAPFTFFTLLGNEGFFLVFLPFVYWCIDRRTGARLTVLFLVSAYVNTVSKALADQPRPFRFDSRIAQLVPSGGGGFPSGHTQGAVVVWGYLAARFRNAWVWVLAGCLMVLIPLSRVYLGVHFPTDLLGGYAIGGLLLLLYLRLETAIESLLVRSGVWGRLGAAALGPVLLLLVLPPGGGQGTAAAATLWGMGVGFVLERRWVRFEIQAPWITRILRFFLGAAVLIGLWAGLKPLFDPLGADPVLRFVRYGVLGLWGGLGAPWVFVRLGMAKRT